MAKANLPAQAESINRRSILKSTGALIGAAAIGVGTSATAKTVDPDARLLALWADWQETYSAAHDAHNLYDEAEFQARKDYPSPPRSIMSRNITTGALSLMHQEDIKHYYRINPLLDAERAKALCEARLKILEDWQRKCRAIDAWHGLGPLDKAAAVLWKRLDGIEKEILETPAKTASGIFVKLSVWNTYCCDDEKEDLPGRFITSALESARRLTPKQAT